ncbi:MAG: hypothetical protein PUC20_01065 [Firmicutes bacterium]|nr:hypothetical protein [Bacillota bacterium]
MDNLKIIDGRLSENYNHYQEFRFDKCICTDTRLMGVVAMRIIWVNPECPDHSYQMLLHLDYSEYGVDEMFEFEVLPDAPVKEDYEYDVEEAWYQISSDLGGKLVEVTPACFVRLIDDAIDVARLNIMTGFDEHADFRSGSLKRIYLMRDALSEQGLLNRTADRDEAISAVIPTILTANETIHYFVMRLADRDFAAAEYLSTLSGEELKKQYITGFGIQSLIKNSIGEPQNATADNHAFALETVTLSGLKYKLFTSIIQLSGGRKDVNPKVTGFETGYAKTLSQLETALAIMNTEYITVYDIPDEVLSDFDISDIDFFKKAKPRVTDNGWFIPVYNKDNSHVRLSVYRIGGDLSASALVSIPGELIIMSTRLLDASLAESSVSDSRYSDKLVMKGRYQINEPVFQTLCTTTGAMFEDLISFPDK